jgi:peptidoglycan hydrolase-like protein with peptidoglycan-binding domain
VPFNQPILQFGDSGPEVTRLQEDLIAVGCFSDVADGSFAQSTFDAVVLFQSAVGLPTDGVVGQDTWSVLEGPEATVEDPIDVSDLTSLNLAVAHASDPNLDDYLAELGIPSEDEQGPDENGNGQGPDENGDG